STSVPPAVWPTTAARNAPQHDLAAERAPPLGGFFCAAPSSLTPTRPGGRSGGVRICDRSYPWEHAGEPMRRLVGVIACVVLLLIATSGRLAAQGGTVRGRVADTYGGPLARVSGSIEAIGVRVPTDGHGDDDVRRLPARPRPG